MFPYLNSESQNKIYQEKFRLEWDLLNFCLNITNLDLMTLILSHSMVSVTRLDDVNKPLGHDGLK